MNDSVEARLEALGLALPPAEGESYYGATYGTMNPSTSRVRSCTSRARTGSRRPAPAPGTPWRDGHRPAGHRGAEWTAMNALAGMSRRSATSSEW